MLAFSTLMLLACAAMIATRLRRTAALLSLLPLAILSSATAPVTHWMLDRAQAIPTDTENEAHPDTVIVLLAGGIERHAQGSSPGLAGYSRLLVTAQRYLQCQRRREPCRVIVSGGAPQGGQTSEADVYARQLVALGVPMDQIMQEAASANTWQNARNTAAMLRSDAPRVVLVTSGLHLDRSRLYFRHFGVNAEGLPSDRLGAAPGWLPSAFNLLLVDVMLHERIGVLRYHAYNRLGWNEPPIPPANVNPQTTTRASPH
ncbi:YdcF family protein [Stenotrophomonas maltophilia]|uniref:YdcF family protein n=1 Tax=Stenotrophomonas maltophilia TaxID=40324 RepID=UPI0039F64AA6